jgi:uncharacterized protein (TIGR02757 family)
MICNNCNRLLSLMENRPYDYLMDEGYEDLPPEQNIHRTFFGRNFRHMMRGLRRIYSRYPSLDAFAYACGAPASETPSWHLAAAINAEMAAANNGATDSRCLPLNLDTSALKRLNMALRWFVRRDGIVDLGIWHSIAPSQLYIPLDVHAGNTARDLGLLTRRANDRRSAIMLTEALRPLRPDDPTFYDYALFGLGIEAKSVAK